jgi:hypothetical protein
VQTPLTFLVIVEFLVRKLLVVVVDKVVVLLFKVVIVVIPKLPIVFKSFLAEVAPFTTVLPVGLLFFLR